MNNSAIILVNFKDDSYLNEVSSHFENYFQIINYSFFSNPKIKDDFLDINYFELTYESYIVNKTKYHYFDNDLLFDLSNDLYLKAFETFCSSLDRILSYKISIRETKSYFFWLLNLLSLRMNLIKDKYILKGIIFDSTPHMPWDIVLFYLGKNFKLKTIYAVRTDLKETMQFYEEISFWSTPIEIKSFKNDTFMVFDFSDRLKKYQNIAQVNKYYSLPIFIFRTIFTTRWIKSFVKSLLNINGRVSLRIFIYLFLSEIKYLLNLISSYRGLIKYSSKLDLKLKKYIYFPLHGQPERTTDPESGIFSDQLLAIKLLSQNIPINWSIIVKEHPVTYKLNLLNKKKSAFRSITFYKELIKIPNVILIDPNFLNYDLISNCQYVATCSGSSTFEGLAANKPSIIFGNSWLRHNSNSIPFHKISAHFLETNLSNLSLADFKENNQNFINRFSKTFIHSINSIKEAEPNSNIENLIENFVNASIEIIN